MSIVAKTVKDGAGVSTSIATSDLIVGMTANEIESVRDTGESLLHSVRDTGTTDDSIMDQTP